MCLIFRRAKAPKDEKAMAYVQLFTNPTAGQVNDASQLFSVNRKYNQEGERIGKVIDLEDIIQPCPLTPRFGKYAEEIVPNEAINGDNCMELCDKFYVNCFHDQLAYQTLW
jgi:hypothetical protein